MAVSTRIWNPGGTQILLFAGAIWAPTRTSHDPNPPITLEDAPAAPAGDLLPVTMVMLTGVGR